MPTNHILSEEELEKLLHKVLDDRQETVGHPTNSIEARAAVKADAEFIRRLRLAWEAGARKIGNAILSALAVGILALIGLGAKKLGAF